MNKYKDYIKYFVGVVIRSLWLAAAFFIPVKKNRVLFDSFLGKQYSCNPRAVYEKLRSQADDFEFVWVFKDTEGKKELLNNDRTIICRYRSLKHYYYMITSGFIVFNWKITYDMPVRKSQTLIQTWHGGGCYKTAGTSIKENSDFHSRRMVEEINRATYYISSSKYFSEKVIKEQNQYKGNILSIGMPRNDRLINGVSDDVIRKIRNSAGIAENKVVVLYAPTYRDSSVEGGYQPLDVSALRAAVEQKYSKEAVIAYRGHHNPGNTSSDGFDIDLSDYPDMQDLLIISDILITDYSSSIWDYSFTYKACFLYTPDLKEYEKARGFDEDIYSWGFPVTLSNSELNEAIVNFDENDFKSRMEKHHEKLGSFENGTATEQVCSLILGRK